MSIAEESVDNTGRVFAGIADYIDLRDTISQTPHICVATVEIHHLPTMTEDHHVTTYFLIEGHGNGMDWNASGKCDTNKLGAPFQFWYEVWRKQGKTFFRSYEYDHRQPIIEKPPEQSEVDFLRSYVKFLDPIEDLFSNGQMLYYSKRNRGAPEFQFFEVGRLQHSRVLPNGDVESKWRMSWEPPDADDSDNVGHELTMVQSKENGFLPISFHKAPLGEFYKPYTWQSRTKFKDINNFRLPINFESAFVTGPDKRPVQVHAKFQWCFSESILRQTFVQSVVDRRSPIQKHFGLPFMRRDPDTGMMLRPEYTTPADLFIKTNP